MTLDGRALGETVWLSPSGTQTITLDVSTSDDPDISGRDVQLWFQPLALGAPDVSESLVTVTRDATDAATGVVSWTFDKAALWTEVGSSTVRCLVLGDGTGGDPWWSLLVVLDLDGTKAQSAVTLPAIMGGELNLTGTLSAVAGAPGLAGADGKTVLSGAGVPDDGADGVDGDFYIDTDGPTLYGPKAAGAWGSGTSLVGPAGAGTGDVVGPAGATADNFAGFDGTTGTLIKDSGASAATFATAAQGGLADTATQPGDLAAVATSGAYADVSGTPTLGTAAAAATGDFATAAQGTLAGTAVQPAGVAAALFSYIWGGSAYGVANSGTVPAGAPRRFVGPNDPDTEGFTLVAGDEWVDTTP